jgi:hypothetical protein
MVGVRVARRTIYFFGTRSLEQWYDSGGVDNPFSRIDGAFFEVGCIAKDSIAEMDSVFWLGGKKTAMGRAVGIIARDFVLNDKFKMPSRIIAEAAMEYSTCIEKMFEWGRVTIGGSTRGIYKSVVLAVALVTIRHCEQKAQHFWPRVVDGVGLAVGDSRLLLRDFIMRPQQGGSAIMFDVMTKTIGAWNHFYDNGFKPMSRLKGNVSVPHIEGTPYPLRNKGE